MFWDAFNVDSLGKQVRIEGIQEKLLSYYGIFGFKPLRTCATYNSNLAPNVCGFKRV